MFSNLSTVCLWAGYGVSHGIFQLRVKHMVWSLQFPPEQQPFTGSYFDETRARELSLFPWKAITENIWIHLN